ncbi:MAG: helix-turn-helix domain-containing protein, partial [Psychrosphaera sp.]|nr:helix-turn-helix domain-containing protein [Psychrosphaera sp.]
GSFIPLDGPANGFSFLIGWHFFLPALYGPFLYLYCRHAINERPFKPRDLLHFSSWLACVLLNYKILFASGEQKLAMFASSLQLGWQTLVTDVILYSQAFIYVALSAWLILRYQRQARTTLSNFNPQIFAWLWTILLLDLTIWLLKVVGGGARMTTLSVMGDVLIVVFIYSIALAQWRNPSLFKIEQPLEPESENKTKPQIKTEGALDASIRSSLLSAVQEYMRVHEAFRDSQLTLTRLAEAVGVSTHHLSEVLNQQEGKNFYQFVNEYRINDICQKMKADNAGKVLDLAMAAGFASKSTFNAVFKQLTGTTPTQYRKSLS